MECTLALSHGHHEPGTAHVDAAVRGQLDVILTRHDTRKLLIRLAHVLTHHRQPVQKWQHEINISNKQGENSTIEKDTDCGKIVCVGAEFNVVSIEQNWIHVHIQAQGWRVGFEQRERAFMGKGREHFKTNKVSLSLSLSLHPTWVAAP